jgi:hypothetical protein
LVEWLSPLSGYRVAVRLPLPLLVSLALGCGQTSGPRVESGISQTGGELVLRGNFGGGRGVVVLVDGVAASDAVFESPTCLRARVPPLPRSGTGDVELRFADGENIQLGSALRVSAPPLNVRE